MPFEKKRIEGLRCGNLPTDSVLLYEDEKGPIAAAKTYGGASWSSITQSGVSKAQKTKGILNVFGVYDYTPTTRCGHTVTNKRQAGSSWISQRG